jgi:diacylglycerol O-acyltransferase / wax synthase
MTYGGDVVASRAGAIDSHMRASDAFSWYMERDPLLRSTVVAVGFLDRAPDRDRLRTMVERASRIVPGMHHIVQVPPLRLATPRWTRTDEVDLDWHLRWVTAKPPGDANAVIAVAKVKATTAFDPARPLWEMTVVEGLRGGAAGFVWKFHHALTDGIGGMQLALELFDLERSGGPRPAAPQLPAEHLDSSQLAWDAVAHEAGRLYGAARAMPGAAVRTAVHTLRHPRATAEGLFSATRSVAKTVAPYGETLSPVMRDRHLGRDLDILEVPLSALRAAAAAADGHLNDAFLAAVTGGLRIYHQRHGVEINRLRVTMPINVRKPSDGPGGNRITLARFPVPAGLPDPDERMRAMRSLSDAWRAEPSVGMTQGIAAVLNVLPTSFLGGMLKHVDFLASNVPGFPMPVYLAGGKLLAYYPFGPTIGAAVNVTLMSYQDTCCVGVNADTGAIPDPAEFVVCLREGFREVLAVGERDAEVRLPLHDEPRAADEDAESAAVVTARGKSGRPLAATRGKGGEAPWR